MITIQFDDAGHAGIKRLVWDGDDEPSATLDLDWPVRLPFVLPREMSFVLQADGGPAIRYLGHVLSQSEDGRELRITDIREAQPLKEPPAARFE